MNFLFDGDFLGWRCIRIFGFRLFWLVLVLGGVTLIVLGGWMDPPLAFLLDGTLT